MSELKRAHTPGKADGPLTKVPKLIENAEDQNNKRLPDANPLLSLKLQESEGTRLDFKFHKPSDNLGSTVHTSSENAETTTDVDNDKSCKKTPLELKLPSFIDTNCKLQAKPFEANEKYRFGMCIICKKSLDDEKPLLLGCLHSCCSKCILQKKHFRISDATGLTSNNSSKNSSSSSLDVGKHLVPDSAFESLDSLKKFISESNLPDVKKLVVRCTLCDCGTKAKVLLENRFSYNCQKPTDPDGKDAEKTKIKYCTNCDENSKAVRFCKDCLEHLCQECVNAHKRVKLTKDHTLQDVENREINKDNNVAISRQCNKHAHEQIKLFCETCGVLTCRDCQLESHREHRYLFVQEAAECHKKILETMREKLAEKKYFLSQTSNTINSRLNTMLQCREKACKDIVQFHSELQKKLTLSCQFFLNKIEEITSSRYNKMAGQLRATDRLCAAVDHCVNFIDFACEERNKLALLEAKQMIMEYMTTVMRQKFTTAINSSDIMFVPDKDIEGLIANKLGLLRWSTPTSRSFQSSSPSSNKPTINLHHYDTKTPNNSWYQRTPQTTQNYQPHQNKALPVPMPSSMHGPRHPNLVCSPRPHMVPSSVGGQHLTQPNVNPMQPKQQLHHLLQQRQQQQVFLQQQLHQPLIRLHRPQHNRSQASTTSSIPSSSPNQQLLSLIRSPYSSPPKNISKQPSSFSQTRPFVSRAGGVTSDFNMVKLIRRDSDDFTFAKSPSNSFDSNFIPSIPERLISEPIKPSFLGEVAAMTHQQVLPHINPGHSSPAAVTKTSQNSAETIEKCGSISSGDSGFGAAPSKQSDNVHSLSKQGLNLSPPPLVDLTGLVKIEETSYPLSPPLQEYEDKVRDDSESDDMEKILCRLVEEETTSNLEMAVKKGPLEDHSARFENTNFEEKYLHEHSPTERKFDPNEDWCAVCNNGGDLLCCDTCPKVFHLYCHVPEIMSAPPGTWQCTLCRDVDKTLESETKYPKRKRTSGLSPKEEKICEKLLLDLFCCPQSLPFQSPVRSVPNYYKVIKEPMDLSKIKRRLSSSNLQQYFTTKEFLQDVQLIFTNCFIFNGEDTEIGKMGLKLQKYFVERVEERMPVHSDYVASLIDLQKSCVADYNKANEDIPEERSNKEVQVDKPPKRGIAERSKSVPYECDTLWQPGDEDEEEESLVETSDNLSEEDELGDSSVVDKKRKKPPADIVHIK